MSFLLPASFTAIGHLPTYLHVYIVEKYFAEHPHSSTMPIATRSEEKDGGAVIAVKMFLAAYTEEMAHQRMANKAYTELIVSKLDELNNNIKSLGTQLTNSSEVLDASLSAVTRGVERVAERIETVLADQIATSLDTSDTVVERAASLIESTLKAIDTTITAKTFSTPPDPSTPSERFDIDATMRKRNLLVEKFVRSDILSTYYEELLNEPTPYAQPKFRTKVTKNVPERDLKHRRLQTISNVKTEIEIMKDRITDWKQQIDEIDADIEGHYTDPTERAEIITKVLSHEPRFRQSFTTNNLNKLKESDEKNKSESFDSLLEIVDEESKSSKNERGRYHRGNRSTRRGRY